MGRGIRFTTEFKREAVRLVLSSGRPRTEIAEGLHANVEHRRSKFQIPGAEFTGPPRDGSISPCSSTSSHGVSSGAAMPCRRILVGPT